jgi:hypothetical protein
MQIEMVKNRLNVDQTDTRETLYVLNVKCLGYKYEIEKITALLETTLAEINKNKRN